MKIKQVDALIKKINAERRDGVRFYVGSTYGHWDLWAIIPGVGKRRISSGKPDELYEAMVHIRFITIAVPWKSRRGRVL